MKSLNKFLLSLLAVAILFCSCNNDSYLNVIPASSSALISVDMPALAEKSNMADKGAILKSLLGVDDPEKCGIDLASKLYLFESAEGHLGLCAKVSSESDLEEVFNTLNKKGVCEKISEKRGFHFTTLKNVWLAGYSDDALIVMGPVVKAAQAELQQKMARYLDADDEDGIKDSPMFEKLDSMSAPMALVAKAQALPQQFVAPFTLGAPKGTDASQIMIAADLSIEKGRLKLDGETFSFNKKVDESLKQAAKVYRPIQGKYLQAMPSSAVVGMFMNVDGKQFLPMMQNNNALQMVLAGINTAIDMDNIMRSVNGDLAIIVPVMSESNTQLMMGAQLAHSNWLADVDYWKQSCPQGSKITNWGKNAFCYTDGKTSYFFGVSNDLQYYSGSSKGMALGSIKVAPNPIAADLQAEIKGKKLVMVINIDGEGKEKEALAAMSSILQPLFGNLNSIVYSLK